jgi:CDP-L-myo-inositol myo-inositolphosphotransferase
MEAREVSVVLADALGERVVGMRVRARNQRVVQRAGAMCVDLARASELPPDRMLLALRADLVLQPLAFAQLPQGAQGACMVGPEAGPHALFGAARDVLPRLAAFMDGALQDVPRAVLGPNAAFPARDGREARRVTTALLKLASKATDGIVSRNVNRRVSRFFSRIFLMLRMTPLHASILNLVIGLLCAYYAAQTGYATMALAGALFQLASAFDGVDGEMARTTLSESVRGAWIDTAVDNATYAACLVGVSLGWMREGIGPLGIALCAALIVSVPMTLLALMRFVHRYGPDGSLVFVDRCVERAAQDSGLASLRVARLLFYALRRDVFAALFFFVSLTGMRAAVPITVAIGVAIALLTLLGHRAQLLAAAQALAIRP